MSLSDSGLEASDKLNMCGNLLNTLDKHIYLTLKRMLALLQWRQAFFCCHNHILSGRGRKNSSKALSHCSSLGICRETAVMTF